MTTGEVYWCPMHGPYVTADSTFCTECTQAMMEQLVEGLSRDEPDAQRQYWGDPLD
jgi:hypothetical protein